MLFSQQFPLSGTVQEGCRFGSGWLMGRFNITMLIGVMTLSPDGKWLWNGENWIPAPPKASPSAIEEAKEAIQKIAEKHGLDVQELSKVVENFDLDEDGSIDTEEIEKAVHATEIKPDKLPPEVELMETDFSIDSTDSVEEILPKYVLESDHKNDYRNYASPPIPSPNWPSSTQKDIYMRPTGMVQMLRQIYH